MVAEQDESLLWRADVRVAKRTVGCDAPFEDRAGDVQRAGNDPVTPARVVRADVDDQRAALGGFERVTGLEPRDPRGGHCEQLLERSRAGHGDHHRAYSLAVRRLVATTVLALALVGVATAGPPDEGVLVPGVSLGGAHLGWTTAQVEALWGRAEGHCRSCRRDTLYFNRYAFKPQGVGVELVRGRVRAIFTLWAPPAWHTSLGVRIGEPLIRVEATYPGTIHTPCTGYDAYALLASKAQSVIYVSDGKVWGFGLLRPGRSVCI